MITRGGLPFFKSNVAQLANDQTCDLENYFINLIRVQSKCMQWFSEDLHNFRAELDDAQTAISG